MFKKYKIYISTESELERIRVAELLTYMKVKYSRSDRKDYSRFVMKVNDSELDYIALNLTFSMNTCMIGLILKSGRSLSLL